MLTKNLLRREWQNGVQEMFCNSSDLNVALLTKDGVPNGSKLTVIADEGCSQYIFDESLKRWIFYKMINVNGVREGMKVKEVVVNTSSFTLIDSLYRANVVHGVQGNVQVAYGYINGNYQIIDFTIVDANTISISTSTNDTIKLKIFYI